MTPDELRRIRAELGLSQQQLAEEIGVTQAAVSLLESGDRKITPRTARQVRQLVAIRAARRALEQDS